MSDTESKAAAADTNISGYIGAGGSAIGGMSALTTGIFNSQIQSSLYNMRRDAYLHDAKMAEIKRQQVAGIYDEKVTLYMQQVGALIGKQKVNLASQNVKIEKGSAGAGSVSQVTESDARQAAADEVNRIGANASAAMLGIDSEIMNARNAAGFASAEGSFKSSQSLLGGASMASTGFMNSAYRFSKIGTGGEK